MIGSLLGSLLYFPSRAIVETPGRAGLAYRDVALETDDGERLHGWWIGGRNEPLGHLLLCHGNAGNVGDRVLHAALLTAGGFDVLLFDYRGYGPSSGTPSEEGTYRDARAALRGVVEQPGVDPARVFYLGESLGGSIALNLALEHPPAGLVLLSAFTGVRDLAGVPIRLSPHPWFPTPTRPCAASPSYARRCWCSTATMTKSYRSRRAEPCLKPRPNRSTCTCLRGWAITTSSHSPGPSSRA
jgi:uncharacterized protein